MLSVSTSPIIARYLENVPAVTIAFWRMGFGALILWVISLVRKQNPLRNENLNRTMLELMNTHLSNGFSSTIEILMTNLRAGGLTFQQITDTFKGKMAPLVNEGKFKMVNAGIKSFLVSSEYDQNNSSAGGVPDHAGKGGEPPGTATIRPGRPAGQSRIAGRHKAAQGELERHKDAQRHQGHSRPPAHRGAF